jgi:rhamnosyltransferase
VPTCSVIIRAYNEGAHLGRLLRGLAAQTMRPDELILVDSGSTDDTRTIAEAGGCRVVPIRSDEFSFGRALNRGCHAATGDVLLIVSAHVYPVYDTFVEHMLRPFVDGTDVAYGRQIGNETTKYSESRLMSKWFPEQSIWDQGHPFSNNANAAVRRTTWERFRYDEDLTGLEDLEFGRRVINAGGKVSYVAEGPVVHVHEETWSTIRNRYRREAIAYRRIMHGRAMPGGQAVGLALTNIASDYWHAAREGMLRTNLLSIPRFRAAQFQGAWEGSRVADRPSEALLRRFYYPTEFGRQAPPAPPGRKIEYDSARP